MLLLMGVALAACQRSSQRSVLAADSRRSRAPSGDSLTVRQRCFISEFERDSLPGAACMTQCIRDGSGYGIGGGCWHLCYAYTGIPIPAHARFEHCPSAGPGPVSPRPMLSCASAHGKRELRIRFVDALTNAPLAGAMLLRPRSRAGAQADSLGALDIAVADSTPLEYVGWARGHAHAVDTIALQQNSVCDVVMRLTPARGHGF